MGFPRLRVGVPVVVGIAALLTAVPALAYVCHPDSPGTKTFVVHGWVSGYSLDGAAVRITFRDAAGCERSATWQVASRTPATIARADCSTRLHAPGRSVAVAARTPAALTAGNGAWRAVARDRAVRIFRSGVLVHVLPRHDRPPAAKLVFDGGRLAVLARPSARADAPDRLELYAASSGRLLHDWPLLARPRTLSLSGGVAAFAAAGGRGLYAIRLADGRQTLVSPIRRKDTPQIGTRGLVYESSLMRAMRQPDRFVLKFVPAKVVGADMKATVDRLRTRWPITSFTMDGQRVGVVLNAPGQACDQIHYWNIPWHYFARINMPDDLTCSRHMSIRSLSLGGLTSEWVAVRNHIARVVMSNSIACIERVVATGSAAGSILLAGDRGLLGLGHLPGSTLLSRSGFDPVTRAVVASARGPVLSLSADDGRLASLGTDGRVTFQRPDGTIGGALAPGTDSRAIALRRNRLVVLAGSRLEVWNTARDGSCTTGASPREPARPSTCSSASPSSRRAGPSTGWT